MVNILNFATVFYNLDDNIAKKVGNFSRKNYYSKVNFWTHEEALYSFRMHFLDLPESELQNASKIGYVAWQNV